MPDTKHTPGSKEALEQSLAELQGQIDKTSDLIDRLREVNAELLEACKAVITVPIAKAEGK